MALTKPAGVFLQIIGFSVLIIGASLFTKSTPLAITTLALSGFLIWAGRQPAIRHLKNAGQK